MKNVIKHALIDSIATALYIAAVGTFMYLAGQGAFGRNETFLIPIAMLMLFVFSAALTGLLMFGKPLMWYLDGKKKEALSLLGYTLVIFLLITFIIFFILIVFLAG